MFIERCIFCADHTSLTCPPVHRPNHIYCVPFIVFAEATIGGAIQHFIASLPAANSGKHSTIGAP